MTRSESKETGMGFRNFFSGGRAAGFLAAVVVILLFLLGVTWLKSLVFGGVLAYFFLPLEKFFERRFSRISLPGKTWFSRFRNQKETTEEEEKKEEYNRLVFRASMTALASVVLGIILFFAAAVSIVVPFTVRTGKSLAEWTRRTDVMEKTECAVRGWLDKHEGESRTDSKMNSDDGRDNLSGMLRAEFRKIASENKKELAIFAMNRGGNILHVIFMTAKKLGIFAFDLLLTFFFFFYFLQKMALFEGAAEQRKINGGAWLVGTIFQSPWMPETSEKTREYAAEIIGKIGTMLGRWVRGYLTIIVLETVIYTLAFTAVGVPYALPAGIAAGLTILLPFLGPIASFALTAGLCLAFCESDLVFTLIGVAIVYLLVNGILEQMFLYPKCVGGATGLTTVETIIVVLLGGLAAGITGMIFAVPAAAVVKYLIREIYDSPRPSNN